MFFLANRQSYHGYFQDDDLDTLGWTPFVHWFDYASTFFSWKTHANNFRPVGHLYYRLMELWAGLDFTRWLAVLQALHMLNVLLLWFVLRRLRFNAWAAAAGCLLFAFHPALFDAYWKPMYIFDVTCGCFCLLSLLCYVSDRWVLSVLCFFAAYRCKEMAIMLPLVLALYELWIGEKRWKRLIPFFAISLCLGLQALTNNQGRTSAYSLKLTPESAASTGSFYATSAFLLPWAAAWILLVPVWTKDRRAYVGLIAFWVMLAPLLLLPGRLFAVYLYVPVIGLAMLAASAVERKTWVAVLAAVVWIPAGLYQMQEYATRELRIAEDIHRYVSGTQQWLQANPATKVYRYDGLPDGMKKWAVPGLLTYITHRGGLDVDRYEEGMERTLTSEPVTFLIWDGNRRSLHAVLHGAKPDAADGGQ